jgi:hypothetical protein
MKHEASPCRALVVAQSPGLYSVAFELTNPSATPLSLRTFEPFVQFQLRAEAAGSELPVHQPALDIGLQRKDLEIPAGGHLLLATPILLQLSAAAAAADRFTWSIAHAPAGLSLIFTLDLPAPFDQPCQATPAGE